ncbi:MAG: exonuclease SbcCD subunit D [Bradyrhizobium sp.]|uniref:metallophosphoesterase family protein n=1 Tax=Bradyrhizobium sp. TaxID=376 RepID=UPI003D0FE40C
MRFLHASDLHLDSPLRGLERYEGAPVEEVRGATRRAFENMVQCALREKVDFVVIAGDLYDGDWPDFNTGLFFAKGMVQLGESGIAVYVVRGNHDAASKLTRSLPLPKNVHLFPDKAPKTLTDDNLGLAVHGQSFATAAVLDDLAADYPNAVPGLFNLGVLHTSLTGRPGHDNYAPTTEMVLKSKGYDYWGLGHVHAREIVLRDPWVVYPGNPQGRHIREQGAKGCELVTVEDGKIATESIELDVLRWTELVVDVAGLPDLDALLGRAAAGVRTELAQADGRILGLRFRLQGAGPVHREVSAKPDVIAEQLRAVALEVSGGNAWLEKVDIRVRPVVDIDQLAIGDDPVGLLVRELRTLAHNQDSLASIANEALKELRQKLLAELGQDEAMRLDAPDVLKDLLGEAEAELLARLAGESGSP